MNKFVCYLKAPILTYSIHQDQADLPFPLDDDQQIEDEDENERGAPKGISQVRKALLNNINSKQIKSYFFI